MTEPLSAGGGGVDHNSEAADAAEAKAQQGLLEGITAVSEVDVLCGRGGAALRHPGNQTYRRLVNLNKGLYITCLKTEKLKISRSIVAAIREQKGRFLEKDNKNGSWFDIGDKKAIEKTSQALREGQPKLRQKIVEMGGGAVGAVSLMESNFGPTAATLFAAADADYVSGVSGSNDYSGAATTAPSNHSSSSQNNMPPPQDMAAMAAAMRSMQVPQPPPQPQQRQHSGQYHQHHHHQQQQQQQQHHQELRHPGQQLSSLSVDDFLLQHADSLQNLSLQDMSETHLQRPSSQQQQRSSSQFSQDSQQQQQQQYNLQSNNANSFRQRILRPSLTGRPTVPQELGMQQESQLSLMSDFSSFGTSGHSLQMVGSSGGCLANESLLSLGVNTNDSYRGGGGSGGAGALQQRQGSLTMMPPPLSSALSAMSHNNPGELYSEDDQGGSAVNSRQGMMPIHHHHQQHQEQQQQHYPRHHEQPNMTSSSSGQHGGGRRGESAINSLRNSDITVPATNRTSSSVEDIDRRRVFATMKYSRPPSDRAQNQNGSSTHRVSQPQYQQQQQQQQQQSLPHASNHSLGDGMPDIYMVESSLSLHSNLSTMTDGHSKKHLGLGSSSHHQNNMMLGGSNHYMSGSSSHIPSGAAVAAAGGGGSNSNQAATASAGAQLPAGVEVGKVVDHSSNSSSRGMDSGSAHNYFPEALLGGGSRHSIMSGLSRISDTSLNDGGDGAGSSIFSDLSRKIGNASTRSMAMSDISGIDIMREREDEDDYDDDDNEDDEDDDTSHTQDFAGEGEN